MELLHHENDSLTQSLIEPVRFVIVLSMLLTKLSKNESVPSTCIFKIFVDTYKYNTHA